MAASRSNSITSLSSLSSRASSAEPAETMQIFIKNIAGDTFPMTIPQSTSVDTLRQILAVRKDTPQNVRLTFAGKHLSEPSSTLQSYNIIKESIVNLSLPLRGGAPKKIRCQFKDCKDAAQRIFGDCGFCSGHFCGKHRMLESHNCSGLENCKEEEKKRNRERLENERTVAIKGI